MALTQGEKREINTTIFRAVRLIKQQLAESAADSDDVMAKVRQMVAALNALRETE